MSYSVYAHKFPNGKMYVGITMQDCKKRWCNGRGYTSPLMKNAIEKYGWDNIEHVVLFSGLSKETACKIEIDLIRKYDLNNAENGYNISTGGESGSLGAARSEKWKSLHVEALNKKVSQYSLGGEKLNEFRSVKDAAESVGGSFKVISANCNGKKRTAYGYVWRFADDGFFLRDCKTGGAHKKAKRTVAYDKNGEKIAEFESAYSASKITGIKKQNIVACCNKKVKTAGGYEWQYAATGEKTNGN